MDDVIRRQDAIEVFGDIHPLDYNTQAYLAKIRALPPAEPERKTGKWIGGELGFCSCCGHEGSASDIWDRCTGMFCPNCGAKMEETK